MSDHQEHQHGHSDGDHHDHHKHMIEDFRKRFWISLILTVPVLLLSPMLRNFFNIPETWQFRGDIWVLFGISTLIFFYGGYPFLKGMIQEIRQRSPGMMTLIALAISVSWFYSSAVVFGFDGKTFFWELASLIDIMLVGHWIEMKSVMGASRALEELAKMMPSTALRINDDGREEEIPASELVAGDQIRVKPGEKIPADSLIVKGSSSLNEALLTGESRQVEKSSGDKIIGGSINGEGALIAKVEKTGKDSYLSQIIQLVKDAQQSKSRAQNLADRAAFWLTIIAISSGALTLIVWLTVVGRDFAFSMERAVSVMIITCPHALGLAVPLVVAVSTSLAAKNGLLIRNRAAFEKARSTSAIIFDKTGTLTKGEFAVSKTVVLDDQISESELITLAASVENNSEHPIAAAITALADEILPVENFRAIVGKGAEGTVDGKSVKIVSPGYLKEHNLLPGQNVFADIETDGKTIVYALLEGQVKGAFVLGDVIRDESFPAIKALKSMGIKCIMLTGDNQSVANDVANELALDEVFSEVLPDGKASKVKEIQSQYGITLMVGDGVNDAPALATADVGVAIGAGTDVAAETADIILVRSNPRDILTIIRLAKSTYSKMIQNLFWATGYNAIAIPLAAGVLFSAGILLSPAVSAILMSISTIVVAFNARLLKVQGEH